jgi:hypothetical protein
MEKGPDKGPLPVREEGASRARGASRTGKQFISKCPNRIVF